MAVQSRNCAAMLSYFIFFLSGLFFKHRQNCRMCEITNKGTCQSQMPFSGGDEGDRFSARTARLGHSRSRQSTGLSLCTAPTSILLSPFLQKNKKKRSTCFSASTSFSGGDEGDRTPYLLNAIQALSRTTRERTPRHTSHERTGLTNASVGTASASCWSANGKPSRNTPARKTPSRSKSHARRGLYCTATTFPRRSSAAQ